MAEAPEARGGALLLVLGRSPGQGADAGGCAPVDMGGVRDLYHPRVAEADARCGVA